MARTPFVGILVAVLLTFGDAVVANEQLITAVKSGDRVTLRSLLDSKGVDVNAQRDDGSTAISWAVYQDDEAMVDLLVRAGADINVPNDFHNVTPLSLACENGNSKVVSTLLAAGADPNIARRTGETPLMTCSNSGAEEGVRALLRRGANVNESESREQQTALMWAVVSQKPKIVKLLVDGGANIAARSRVNIEPKEYVIEMDETESIWASNYPDTTRFPETSGGFTAMHFAAQQGNIESVRVLLGAGADIDESHLEYGTPLMIAIASGNEELASYLLKQGANPNAKDAWGATALHYALYEGLLILNRWKPTDTEHLGWRRKNMPRLVEALLERGADPAARIQYSFPYMIDPFLARSSDLPPQISPVGATPLLVAAASGDVESMKILQPVSDVKATTLGGGTVFLLAAGGGAERNARTGEKAVAAAKLALQMGGGSVNDYLTDLVIGGPAKGVVDGRTALHFATYLGWTDLIAFLVEEGADIEAKDRYGATPLMIALGDPEGRYYRQVGDGNYDLRFRRPGPTPGTGANEKIAAVLLDFGAKPFEGEYRDSSGL